MAQDLLALGITLATEQLKAGLRELERAQATINKTADAADKVGTTSEKAFDKTAAGAKKASRDIVAFERSTTSAFDRVKKGALDVGGSFDRLQRLALGGFAGGALAAGLISSIDAYTKYTAQLKLATQSQDAYNKSLEDVRVIAKAAQADLGAIGTLYARISRNTEQLGFSQEKVRQITEATALALKANGATGAESASAILQLSQAFGSGALRGEEFNAVNEAAPNLIRAIAESLGRPVGEMRKLAEQGVLTSEVLGIALPAALEQFRAEAAQVQTIGGAFVELKNGFVELVGEVGSATGAIGAISGAITGLADIVRNSGPLITGLLTALAAGATVSGLAAIAANIGLVASAIRNLALAFIFLSANPLALAILGIGAIAGGFAYLDERRKKIEENTSAIQKLSEKSRQLAEVEAQLSQVRNADGSIKAGANRLVVRDLLNQELAIKKEMAALEKGRAAKAPNEAAQEKARQQESYNDIMAELDLNAQVAKELDRIAKLEKERGAAAADAAKRALQEKKDYIQSLRTEQAQLEASLATQGKITELDKDRIKAAEIFGGKIPRQIEQQLLLNDTLRDEAELRAEIAKDEAKALEDGDKRIADIIAQAEEVERQNKAYGMGKDAVEELIIAELERKKIVASPEIAEQLEREIQARKRLAGALSTNEALDAQKKAADAAQREFDRVTDDIGKNLAEALFSGGEAGTKKLGEYMKRYFLQLVIRTQIEPVFKQGAGQVLGGGGFGGAGASLGSAAGLLSAFSSGGEAGLILSQGLKMAGNFAQSAYAFTQTGQQFAGLAAGLGKLAPYAGSIAAVLSGNIGGGIGSALGTALGSGFGPLGAAIGGAIGGKLLGGLGGAGKISATALGPQFGADLSKQITEQYLSTVKALGGRAADVMFSAYGNTGRQGQNPNFTAFANVGGRQVFNSFQTAEGQADGLFLAGEIGLNDRNLQDQSLRATIAALKETNFAANVNAFFDTVNVASASFEELTASLQTAQLLKFVNDEFRSMGGALATLADQSIETLTQFFAMNGGIEGLSAGLNAFYDAFYTEQEKTERLTKQLTSAFAEFNKPLPQSRLELRALVDSLDLRNTADQQLYATILQLTPALNQLLPAFDSVGDSIAQLLGQITDQATQAVDKQISLSQRAANEARDAARAYGELAKSLRGVGEGILTQALGGANLGAAFQSTFARAITGDREALGVLGGQAQGLVENIGNTAVSRVDFVRQTSLIRNQVEQAAKVSDALGVNADYQAKIFDVQTAILETLKQELESGDISAQRLQEIKTALDNVQGAINFAAGLTVEQLLGVQGQLLGQTSITQIVAAATEGSETLLNAVLNRLSAQDSGTESIVAQLQKGNAEIGGYLAEIAVFFRQQQDAENARRAAEAAEAKRVQDLAAAQSALKAIAEKQSAASSEVARAAGAINPLAGQFGVTLRDSAGGQADFGVNGGLFMADFADILYNVGNEAGVRNFKNTYYSAGGLYDQTYGRAGELQGYLTELEAQRELIRSLGGVPQFAMGGMHSGGLRIVGERGPELEATGPARYWNAGMTAQMMGGGMSAAVAAKLDRLCEEVAGMREESQMGIYQVAKNTGNVDRRLERWDDGDRCRTVVDQEAGETVNVTVIP